MRRCLLATAIALGIGLAAAGCGAHEPPPAGDALPSFRARVGTVQTGGTSIAWYDRGTGRPLVMLTGTGSTMAEWDPALLRLLSAGHRLILFDYPGVGRSGPWHGASFDSLARVTAAFLRSIGIARADLLGWSMGGFVAQRLAIRYPSLVSHVILAATNPGGSQAVLGRPAIQRLDSDPHAPDARVLRELYPPGEQAEGRAFLRRLVTSSRNGEIPDDFHVSRATVKRQVATEGPWLRSNLNFIQLAGLQTPTLATAGLQDTVTPPVNSHRIAARAPHAKLILYPGAHAFLFQSRTAFSKDVDAFTGQ